jgi:hypothetical protein
MLSNQLTARILIPRPSVHLLCRGAFFRENIQLKTGEFLLSLPPLGNADPSRMLAEYAWNVGAVVDRETLDTLIQNGKNQNPSVAIVIPVEG